MLSMILFGKRIFFAYARLWSKILLFISGVSLEIEDYSILIPNQSYIYIANHSSLFDIPILLSTIKGNARIIYKEELEKIPFFGWCLKMSPFISIRREDKENSLEGFKLAMKAISEEDSVIIFPEGTRSTDGQLGEFKKGAFLLAIKSNKEMIPVAIKGSANILSKGTSNLKKGNIRVSFIKNINPKENPNLSIKALMNQIRVQISEKI